MASYTISPIWGAGAQLFDNSGNVLSGGKIYTYLAGTTTPAITYTTPVGNVQNSNPIVANSAGRLVNEIWLQTGVAYKFVLKDANDVLIATYDNIPSSPAAPITNDASSIAYEQGYQVSAGNFTVGATYLINFVGTTDFTAIGASINEVGQHFVATGVGSGTGTALYSRTVQTKLQEFVSVKDFGAIGDGVTDDTAAIQAALNSGAGSIYASSGNYLISSLSIPSNIMIYGDKESTVFTQKAGANFVRPFLINAVSFVTLKDFQINGNGNSQASGEQNHGVFIVDSTDVNIENLIIHDCQGDGIGINSGDSTIKAKRIKIVNNTIYNFGRCGIVISGYGAYSVLIDGNITRVGTRVLTSTSGGNGIHLELDSSTSTKPGQIVVSNNLTDDSISSSGEFVGLVIDSNAVRNSVNNTGFGMVTIINPINVIVSNNSLVNVGGTAVAGIYLEDTVGSAQTISITGNSITSVTSFGIYAYSTILGPAGPLTISGNTIISSGDFGVEVLSDFHYVVIDGNSLRYTTGGIKIGGTNGVIVSNNIIANFGNSIGIWFSNQGSVASNGAFVIGNVVGNASVGTSYGIYLDNTSLVNNIKIIANDFSATNTPMNLGSSTTGITHALNSVGTGSLTGSLTLSAAASTTVSNQNTSSIGKITLTPTNASAAALMGSAACLYVSAKTDKTSFTVSTANGASAVGTETFDYQISN